MFKYFDRCIYFTTRYPLFPSDSVDTMPSACNLAKKRPALLNPTAHSL